MIRGGSSESTVVVADDEILVPPIVPHGWAVLAMHGEGLPKLASKMEPGGLVVANSSLIPAPPAWPGVQSIAVPATDLAKAMGQPLGASMVALGAFAAATGLVGVESLAAAVGDVLPPHRQKLADANRAAIARGAAHVGGRSAGAAAWA